MDVKDICKNAKKASLAAMNLTQQQRKEILLAMADSLVASKPQIIAENEKDLANATDLSSAMKDRLALNDSRFDSMVNGLKELAHLDDKIGSEIECSEDNLIIIGEMENPI